MKEKKNYSNLIAFLLFLSKISLFQSKFCHLNNLSTQEVSQPLKYKLPFFLDHNTNLLELVVTSTPQKLQQVKLHRTRCTATFLILKQQSNFSTTKGMNSQKNHQILEQLEDNKMLHPHPLLNLLKYSKLTGVLII